MSGVTASSTVTAASQVAASTYSTSPQKVLLLFYDAKNFEYDGAGSDIRLPGNRDPVKIKDAPVGVLGIFRSWTQAKKAGKAWLYQQLDQVPDDIFLPLPFYRDDEFDLQFQTPWPGTWRRWGDERSGWLGGSHYCVSDLGRCTEKCEVVELSVSIEEWDVVEVDDGEGYETDARENVAEEDGGD